MTTLTQSEEHIHTILNQDRVWSAYAIADLEVQHKAYSIWIANQKSVVLIYKAFSPAVLFSYGDPESLDELFLQVPLDDYVFTLRPPSRDLLDHRLKVQFEAEMWRMVLDRPNFNPVSERGVEELHLSDLNDIQHLFDNHPDQPDAFAASMLEGGVYFGVREDGNLISVAGTHVLSKRYHLAALGNVFTRPDQRNKGFGTQASASVIKKLLTMGIETIVLNVAIANRPAVRSYTRIGFKPYCKYLEGQGALIA